MSWFVIEILIALAPVGLLLWATVRVLRRAREREAAAPHPGDRPDAGG